MLNNFNNLKKILNQQFIPTGDIGDNVWSIVNETNSYGQVAINSFNYGVICGKRQERNRRKNLEGSAEL